MINSISNATTLSIVNSSQAKSPAAAAQDENAAIRATTVARGTAVEDSSLGAAISVDLSSYMQATVDPYGPRQIAQQTAAGESMGTMKKELGKIDALIAKRRPELSGNWDFKLVEGKLKVTGLAADDAKWVEKKLNSNSALLDAAKSFTSTAVANLQTSEGNPSRAAFNYVSGHMENYTFFDVESQLSEKLSFRSLLTQSDQIFDSKKIVNLSANMSGISGLAVAASVLTASNGAIQGAPGTFYTTKYDPLEM